MCVTLTVLRAPDPSINLLKGVYVKQDNKMVKLRGEYDFTDHWTGFASIGSAHTRYDGYLRGTALRLNNVNGNGFGDTINQKGYSDRVDGLTLSTLVVHSSSQYLDSANDPKAPKYTRYDLGVRYGMSIYEKDVTLRASLENVENRAYWAGSFNEGLHLSDSREP